MNTRSSASAALVAAAAILCAPTATAAQEYWGAIAYSPLDGASGTSVQQPTEDAAGQAAIIDCGTNGGSGCQVVVTVQRPQCASLVASESLYSWGVDPDPAAAKASGLDDLGAPGTEIAATCGYVPGASPAPIPSFTPVPTPTKLTHPKGPPPPPAVSDPPAPTLR